MGGYGKRVSCEDMLELQDFPWSRYAYAYLPRDDKPKHTCREMTRQVCLWQVCLCREMTSILDNAAGFRRGLTSPSPAKSTAKAKNTAKLTTALLASPDDAFVGFRAPKR